MEPNKPVLRLTRPNDINKLVDLDHACYAYPLTIEEWKSLIAKSGKYNEARVIVAEWGSHTIAYGVWTTDSVESSTLIRLGVRPAFNNDEYEKIGDKDYGIPKGYKSRNYRRQGLGRLMLAAFVRHAFESHCDEVFVTVPDIHCNPGDPDDVSVFLNKCGFKANGSIVHDWKVMYGEFVDGYVFERGVL